MIHLWLRFYNRKISAAKWLQAGKSVRQNSVPSVAMKVNMSTVDVKSVGDTRQTTINNRKTVQSVATKLKTTTVDVKSAGGKRQTIVNKNNSQCPAEQGRVGRSGKRFATDEPGVFQKNKAEVFDKLKRPKVQSHLTRPQKSSNELLLTTAVQTVKENIAADNSIKEFSFSDLLFQPKKQPTQKVRLIKISHNPVLQRHHHLLLLLINCILNLNSQLST